MNNITKVTDLADPRRCQHMAAKGQCFNVSNDGYNNCHMHGGAPKIDARRTYALTRFHAQVAKFADDPQLKSLNEEIGILRLLMESTINSCEDSTDLLLQSGSIGDMATKLEKLVSSCDRLDHRRGQVLDKGALLRFAGQVVDIISETLADDDEKVGIIADKILEALGGTKNED